MGNVARIMGDRAEEAIIPKMRVGLSGLGSFRSSNGFLRDTWCLVQIVQTVCLGRQQLLSRNFAEHSTMVI